MKHGPNKLVNIIMDKEWADLLMNYYPLPPFEDDLQCPAGFTCSNGTCYEYGHLPYSKYLKK